MIWLPIAGNYADIDAYASVIAYTELLNQCNKSAKSYIPFAPNYSVPSELRLPEYENSVFNFCPNDQAIILDVSIPEAINHLVPDNQILEIIDHHPGYEKYWHELIGDKAIIEKIGAVATSIFERWGKYGNPDKMPPQIAKLLLGAILDNTLNFNANTTTDRDRQAASQLAKIAKTTIADFTSWYFSTISNTITKDLRTSLSQDCKQIKISQAPHTIAFGQLTLWDSENVLPKTAEIAQNMSQIAPDWLVNVICISERKKYILTSSSALENYFANLLHLQKQNDYLVSQQLYLRKEIIGKTLNS